MLNRMGGQTIDKFGSRKGQVLGSGECDNEPSGSTKCGEFLD
jgi:hypothetical protein